MFQNVRGIVFDLDDTLCAYWDAVKQALPLTFEKYQMPPETLSIWIEEFHFFAKGLKKTDWYPLYLKSGEPTRTELMRRVLVQLEYSEALASELSSTYAEERDRALKLFPESLSVLAELKHKFKLGVLTNGPADVQRQELATLGISEFFDGVWIEGEMGVGKPLRKSFSNIEESFGLLPEQLLMVGNDFGHDIIPSLEYGWNAVWVSRESDIAIGKTDRYQMKKSDPKPHLVIEDLTELLKFLK